MGELEMCLRVSYLLVPIGSSSLSPQHRIVRARDHQSSFPNRPYLSHHVGRPLQGM
jgi:hypothetical protein